MRPRTRRTSKQDVPAPVRIGGNTYEFDYRVGTHGRRYRAHIANQKGRSFFIHVLPRDRSSTDLIAVLDGLPKNDPHLPRVEEHSVQGDGLYVVLSWVPGRPLREFLDEGEQDPSSRYRLSAVEAARLFNGFVGALKRFNRKCNMIHGDIKPENLTVARDPNRLLLIDFGSAWVVERATRREPTEGIDSRLHYAAPELQPGACQASRNPSADFRSDQFSASVVFFEMLTFQVPYGGAGGQAGDPGFRAKWEKSLVPPSQLSPDRDRLSSGVWNAIDRAVLTGLSLDADKRFQNFNSWIDALNAIRIASDRTTDLSPDSRAALKVADVVAAVFKRFRRPNP